MPARRDICICTVQFALNHDGAEMRTLAQELASQELLGLLGEPQRPPSGQASNDSALPINRGPNVEFHLIPVEQ
jgi:hypothetical protein